MSASDLERALAEARAAAARRLNALRQEGRQAAHQEETGHDRAPSSAAAVERPAPPAHSGGAQRPALRASLEPLSEPAPPVAPVPAAPAARREPPPIPPAGPAPAPRPIVTKARHEAPVETLRAAPVQAPLGSAPEPFVARAQPPVAPAPESGLEGVLRTTIQPDAGPDYVPLDAVARARFDPQDGLDADHLAAHERGEAAWEERGGRVSGFVARVLASFAAYRRARAQRREAEVEAQAAYREERALEGRIAPQRQSAKEQRAERRRRRYFHEEIAGWILVPTILVAAYFFLVWALDLMGLTPDIVIDGIRTLRQQAG